MQENNREKWSFLSKNGGKDKQGGTTGVFVQSLSSLLQCFGKGRGFFYCPAPDVRSIKSASFNQKESAPSAHLRGIPYELMARRDAIAASMEKG